MALLDVPFGAFNQLDLPAVCIITGRRDDVRWRDVSLRWAPRPGGLLLYSVISGALNARVVTGQLPFAPGVYERARTFRVLLGASLVGAVALTPVLDATFGQIPALLTMLTLAAVAGGSWLALVAQGQIKVRSIDDQLVHLEIPRAEVAREFALRLEQGALGLGPQLASLLAGHAKASQPAPGASCPLHAASTTVWSCGRCGTFFCEDCSRRLSPSQVVCGLCFENALKLTFTPAKPWWLYGGVVVGLIALIPGCLFVQAIGLLVNGALLLTPPKQQRRTLPAIGFVLSLVGTALSLWALR